MYDYEYLYVLPKLDSIEVSKKCQQCHPVFMDIKEIVKFGIGSSIKLRIFNHFYKLITSWHSFLKSIPQLKKKNADKGLEHIIKMYSKWLWLLRSAPSAHKKGK